MKLLSGKINYCKNCILACIFFPLTLLVVLANCTSFSMNHTPKVLSPGQVCVIAGINAGGQVGEDTFSISDGVSFEAFAMGRFGQNDFFDFGIKAYGGILQTNKSQLGVAGDMKFKFIDFSSNSNAPWLLSGDIELSYTHFWGFPYASNKGMFALKPAVLFGFEFLYLGGRAWWYIPYGLTLDIIVGASFFTNPKLLFEVNILPPIISSVAWGFTCGVSTCINFF